MQNTLAIIVNNLIFQQVDWVEGLVSKFGDDVEVGGEHTDNTFTENFLHSADPNGPDSSDKVPLHASESISTKPTQSLFLSKYKTTFGHSRSSSRIRWLEVCDYKLPFTCIRTLLFAGGCSAHPLLSRQRPISPSRLPEMASIKVMGF